MTAQESIRFTKFFCLLLFIALISNSGLTSVCLAQTDSTTEPLAASTEAPDQLYQDQVSELEKINQKVEAERAKLLEISVKQQRVLDEISQLRTEIETLKKNQVDSEQELTQVLSTRESTERELKSNDSKLRTLKQLSLTRLRAVYMSSRQPESRWTVLLDPQVALHFSRNAWYMSKLRAFDQQLFKRMGELQQARSQKLFELSELGKNQDKVIKKLAEQKKSSELKLNQRNSLIKTLNQQKTSTQQLMRSLQAQAQQLEAVIASLTGGQQLQPAPNMIAASRLENRSKALPTPATKFIGQGLAKLKGLLQMPVKGRVTRHFGKQKNKEFEDFVFNKGLEFLVPATELVRAIADGAVLHIGNMPGYGTILIIDHGQRYYSLYGRLSVVKVKVGDLVKQGEEISELSENLDLPKPAGSKSNPKGNFYFEIRKDGQPVNPQQFIK